MSKLVEHVKTDELLSVSGKMIDAGALALRVIEMIHPNAADSERMVVLWRVMLQVKLGEAVDPTMG